MILPEEETVVFDVVRQSLLHATAGCWGGPNSRGSAVVTNGCMAMAPTFVFGASTTLLDL